MEEITSVEIALSDIFPADINVHRCDIKGDKSFHGLVESIRNVGLVHRIVVSRVGGGEYRIIDGHRRYEAVKAMGMKTIKAEVCNVDDATALEMTIAANVQRLSNDPILEADAIAELRAAGKTTREIASAIGRDDRYVVRRQRLVTLTQPWRNLASRCECTTDMLERIAAFEQRVQNEVASVSNLEESYNDGEAISYDDFKGAFDARMHKLCDAPFDRSGCAKCPYNTAAHNYLFDEMEDEATARCQDGNCFTRRWNDATDVIISRLRAAGRDAIEVADKWSIPNYWECAEVSDGEHPQAYVYSDGGIRKILWSKIPERSDARSAMTTDEKARLKEEKRAARTLRSAYDRIREAFRSASDDTVREIVDRTARFDELRFVAWAKETIVGRISGMCEDNSKYDEIIALLGGLERAEEMFEFCLTDEERKIVNLRLQEIAS